ncbi:MAG TPA: hypothetical protein VMU25_02000 [Candidatus Paceibacterota bacterium]|nr:hypothetical protein [Candidatus Paceibacterota bacterium]
MRQVLFAIALSCAALLVPASSHAQVYWGHPGWGWHPHPRFYGPPMYGPPVYGPPAYYGQSYVMPGPTVHVQRYWWSRTTVTHWYRTYPSCDVCY